MSPETATHGGHGLVAHHFENLEQQRDALTLGMWVFLGSEVLFFGGLFTAYAVMRSGSPKAFALASYQLSAALGGLNARRQRIRDEAQLWTAEELGLLGKVPDGLVTYWTGRSRGAVVKMRALMGLPAVRRT